MFNSLRKNNTLFAKFLKISYKNLLYVLLIIYCKKNEKN